MKFTKVGNPSRSKPNGMFLTTRCRPHPVLVVANLLVLHVRFGDGQILPTAQVSQQDGPHSAKIAKHHTPPPKKIGDISTFTRRGWSELDWDVLTWGLKFQTTKPQEASPLGEAVKSEKRQCMTNLGTYR